MKSKSQVKRYGIRPLPGAAMERELRMVEVKRVLLETQLCLLASNHVESTQLRFSQKKASKRGTSVNTNFKLCFH